MNSQIQPIWFSLFNPKRSKSLFPDFKNKWKTSIYTSSWADQIKQVYETSCRQNTGLVFSYKFQNPMFRRLLKIRVTNHSPPFFLKIGAIHRDTWTGTPGPHPPTLGVLAVGGGAGTQWQGLNWRPCVCSTWRSGPPTPSTTTFTLPLLEQPSSYMNLITLPTHLNRGFWEHVWILTTKLGWFSDQALPRDGTAWRWLSQGWTTIKSFH